MSGVSDSPGFDYICPSCGHSSSVYTVYDTKRWNCFVCGARVNIIPRGNYQPLGKGKTVVSRAKVIPKPDLSNSNSNPDFNNLRAKLGK